MLDTLCGELSLDKVEAKFDRGYRILLDAAAKKEFLAQIGSRFYYTAACGAATIVLEDPEVTEENSTRRVAVYVHPDRVGRLSPNLKISLSGIFCRVSFVFLSTFDHPLLLRTA